MSYLEGKHIIHRDLALRNILVASSNRGQCHVKVIYYLMKSKIPKVADFGMSRVVQENYYNSTTGLFPVKWSAPEGEQIFLTILSFIAVLKFNKTSSKSDVWSFAITLWELFSFGEIPYQGMSNKEVVQQVSEGYRMEIPRTCPAEIASLIQKCWQAEAKDRPNFGQIVKELEELEGNWKSEDEPDYQTTNQMVSTYAFTPSLPNPE